MYYVDRMQNGLIYIVDRASGLHGTYYPDGTYKHGDLVLSKHLVVSLIKE